MVVLGAEVQHRGAEQAPLHARLDLQARVGEHELLEARRCCRRGRRGRRARFGNARCTAPSSTRSFSWPEHALAVLGHGLALDALEVGRAARSRAAMRMSAQVPSSCRPSCVHIDLRGDAGLPFGARGSGSALRMPRRGPASAGSSSARFCAARGLRGRTGAVSTIVGVSSFVCGSGSFHGMTGPRRRGNRAFAPYKPARATSRRGLSRPYKRALAPRWESTSGCRGIRSRDERSVAEERARATRPEQERARPPRRDAEVLADRPCRIGDREEDRADDRQYLEDRDGDARGAVAAQAARRATTMTTTPIRIVSSADAINWLGPAELLDGRGDARLEQQDACR